MAAVISDERIFGRKPNKGLTGAENPSNTSLNDADEPMTKAEREELADLKELVHQQIALASLNAKTQPQIQVVAPAPAPAPAPASRWTSWIQTGVICGMLIVTATNRFVTGEGDLKQEVALQKQTILTLTQAVAANADRQQSLEYIFSNARQQLAALGIQIDPKTGNVEIKRGR